MTCFILGVGVQMSGTQWLHRYLASRPDADMGFAKDYHLWDALTLPGFERIRDDHIAAATQALSDPADSWLGRGRDDLKRLAFLSDPDSYFDYFAGRLARDGIALTGDLTPAYAGLSAETLARIRDGFAARGIPVYPVLLLRDPVARLLATTRAYFQTRALTPSLDEEMAQITRRQASQGDQAQAAYQEILDRLTQVFGPRAFIGFYETLASEDEIRRLCGFLGRPYHPSEVTWTGQENRGFPDPFLATLRAGYADQYAFARKEFDPSFIDRIWPDREGAADRQDDPTMPSS